MLQNEISIKKKRGLYFIKDGENGLKRFTPWLGNAFSPLYDVFMERSVFPKKFGSDIDRHYEILSRALKHIHGKQVLELATGNGSAVRFLAPDNTYIGTDISPGLLRKAARRFREAGFTDAEFYVVSADDLPFEDGRFEVCLCMLSFNFFSNLKAVLKEIKRVLGDNGLFFCSVPVPEKKGTPSPIRGKLYSTQELEQMCKAVGLRFEAIPEDNGALLYFRAVAI
jgi:ubiquinone/menaquinone biosynthesis C-methylase UbiE